MNKRRGGQTERRRERLKMAIPALEQVVEESPRKGGKYLDCIARARGTANSAHETSDAHGEQKQQAYDKAGLPHWFSNLCLIQSHSKGSFLNL